jgi:poly-gamma-glutamate synthesis protein (capsule biosynthesis protein)
MITDFQRLQSVLKDAQSGNVQAREEIGAWMVETAQMHANSSLRFKKSSLTGSSLTSHILLKLVRGNTIENAPDIPYLIAAITRASRELLIDHYRRVSLLFVGDIMLDNGPGNAVNNGKDPFEKCAKLLLDADVTVGNLECVLGKGGKQVNKNYVFRGASDSPKYLKKYFHALSLANNHTLDFGPDGLIECVDVLTKVDIGFFGAGRDLQAARSGLMLDVKGRKIVLLGYNEFRKEDYQATENRAGIRPLNSDWVIEDIRTAKQAWNADIVIPFIHWGNEMKHAPTQEQRTQAKRWIDAGATAVIGGHPHVTQTIDSHRGRPIVYSLGNFVFDYYPVDPAIWYGWAIRLTIPPVGSPLGSQTPEDVLIDWETITVAMDPQGLPYPVDPNE